MAYGTIKLRIEMVVPADVDPSTVLELAQYLALDLNQVEDDELSEAEVEMVTGAVSVETLTETAKI